MKEFINDGPAQLRQALEACKPVGREPLGEFDEVVLLGMGGSALSGGIVDLMRYVEGSPWRFDIVRDYRVSRPPGPRTLVFALSYSGNTEEVLSAFRIVVDTPATVVAVSSGGELQAAAVRKGVPWLKVPPKPEGFQPRFALYFMFGVVYELLIRNRLLVGEGSLPELATTLERLRQEAAGSEVARWQGRRFPVVYVPTEFETSVARTWKIKYNENSKIPAISGSLPEANHNELIAFAPEFARQFAFLLMPDPTGHPSITRRFELFGRLMEQYGYPVRTVLLAGRNPLERCLASLNLADWVTYHQALLREIDPVSIPAIQDFKKLL